MDSVPRNLFLLWSLFTMFLGAHCFIPDHCEGTLYPDLCASTLSAIPDCNSKPLTQVICATINASKSSVRKLSKKCTTYLSRHGYGLETRHRYALSDCLDLFSQTLHELGRATAVLTADARALRVNDVRTVLSAAITNQYTCLDGFAYVGGGGGYRRAIQRKLYHVARLASNSLAMARKIRRRRAPRRKEQEAWFPAWLTSKDRKLLQAMTGNATNANLVVAKDGSGNFKTIGEAIAAAPNKTKTRFVIYVKAGAYFENVEVPSSKTNLMLIGDGIGKTVLKASRNVADGWTTFNSATLGD